MYTSALHPCLLLVFLGLSSPPAGSRPGADFLTPPPPCSHAVGYGLLRSLTRPASKLWHPKRRRKTATYFTSVKRSHWWTIGGWSGTTKMVAFTDGLDPHCSVSSLPPPPRPYFSATHIFSSFFSSFFSLFFSFFCSLTFFAKLFALKVSKSIIFVQSQKTHVAFSGEGGGGIPSSLIAYYNHNYVTRILDMQNRRVFFSPKVL